MESVCVAFDVEASGRTTSECEYPTIAYGYCLGTLDGKILERAQVNIAVNWPTIQEDGTITSYGDFQPSQWGDFWVTVPAETIADLKRDARPPREAWGILSGKLDEWATKYAHVTPVSDCVEFDIARIDSALSKYCSRRPVYMTPSKGCRWFAKAGDDLFETLPRETQAEAMALINNSFAHDHRPVNDASYIYAQYTAYLQHRK